jgi:ComF family protein
MFFEKLMSLISLSCVLCGDPTRRHRNLCLYCESQLPILTHRCHRCAQKLVFSGNNINNCGGCLKNPPAFDRTFALFPYHSLIAHLIVGLKFHHQLHYAKLLGELMTQKIGQEWYVDQRLPDLIIPIPLHTARLKERGFNQAVEIARPIAKSFTIPLDLHGTFRNKKTAAQSGLVARERRFNIANAFSLRRHYGGLSVAVVDDVITTGSTMEEFCGLLKRAGAKHIDVWCCARKDYGS